MPTKTIVLIHGLFMTYHCWDQWVGRYQAKGYTCYAIPYPDRNKTASELRRAHPDPELGKLTYDMVYNHYQKAIRDLPEAPLIIGHSLGGLLTQVLLNNGLGVGGVAIDSGPPQGLLSLKLSFLRANFPALNPLNPSSRPYLMPLATFRRDFVNGFPPDQQMALYEQHLTPESLRVPRGVLSSPNAKINYQRQHAPLLFLAGTKDQIIPASLNQANFAKYKATNSVRELKVFEGRTHFCIGQQGWEELADYALNWSRKHGLLA